MSELIDCINNLSAKDIIRAIAKTANGVPFYLQTSGLAGFCEEYQRIYDDLEGSGTPPSDAIAAAQNTMVCGLVDDGVWAKLDVFYLYAQTTNAAGEALMNWTASGLYNAVAVNAPVFTPLEGFTSGTPAYINWNWNASTDAVNYTRFIASAGCYCRSDIQRADFVFGARDGGFATTRIAPRWTDDNIYSNCNSNGYTTTANADGRGLYIANRLVHATQQIYKNKVLAQSAVNSNAIPTVDFYSLCYNDNGAATSHSTKQISMVFAGAGFTQVDVNNMTDRFETYMDSNGKGVIP